MAIRFNISEDGMRLVVTKINEEHCHDKIVYEPEQIDPVYAINQGNATELKVGAAFSDLEVLYDMVQKYERDNHVHLWKRDGRSIEALSKRAPGVAKKMMSVNPGLRFAELRYCCSHGGRNPDQNRTRFKTDYGDHKNGCEMHIRFAVSEDGSQLVVKSMSEDHNHDINEDAVLRESLHPELVSCVSKLVWKARHIRTEEVKTHLEEYVYNTMFRGRTPPPSTRRQYFPTKKQLRYFIAKSKAALEISAEVEQKLTSLEAELEISHPDDQMIFNSILKKNEGTETDHALNAISTPEDNAQINSKESSDEHILFCHQTPYQQRLLKRYGSQVYLTELRDIHPKLAFPLFCLYVQTNVDCQLVGEFIVQSSTKTLISACLSMFREWNSGWTPKFLVVDYNEEQLSAAEQVFPGCFVLISSVSREKEWNDWLDRNHEFEEHKTEVWSYLQAIAHSFSEETLNEAAKRLEESEVWKSSDKLRSWFQVCWLAEAKRWVIGYRPDDFFPACHTGRTIECELEMFHIIKSITKSIPIFDVIRKIVENIAPLSEKQYESLNEESSILQRELFYSTSNLPPYLSTLSGPAAKHIFKRMLLVQSMELSVTCVQPGVFSIEGGETGNEVYTVSFGDHANFPSCECSDWQEYKLPCVHFATVFNTRKEWSWDMLSVVYKSNPILNVDWGTAKQPQYVPGMRIDNGIQTMEKPSSVNPSDDSKNSTNLPVIGIDNTANAESLVQLATQCISLLNQINELPMHSLQREQLQVIKSDLHNIAFTCSNANLCTLSSIQPKKTLKRRISSNSSENKTSVAGRRVEKASIVAIKRCKNSRDKDSPAAMQTVKQNMKLKKSVEITGTSPIPIVLVDYSSSSLVT